MSEDMDYKRDSFDDRICDDLCQVLLKWLPIDDKIRFTRVSKRFQRCLRTVWSQHKCLIVDRSVANHRNSLCGDIWMKSEQQLSRLNVLNVQRLRQYLQRLDHLEDIRMGTLANNLDEVMSAITEECNHLKHLSLVRSPSEAVAIALGQKFGHQLQSLEFLRSDATLPLLLTLCPNLLSLSGVYLSHLVRENQVFATNVRQLRVEGRVDSHSNQVLTTFVDNCLHLTHLEIKLYKNNTNHVSDLLSNLSKLNCLQVLSIHLNVHRFDQNFAKSVELIAKKCRNIRYFRFWVSVEEYYDFRQLFRTFENFSNLEKFDFSVTKRFATDSHEVFDINCLEKCRQLSHLSLSSDQMNDEFLCRIHELFPKLKHLTIDTNSEITDKTLQSMAKLPLLEGIQLKTLNDGMNLKAVTDTGLLALVFNCNRLHTIRVKNRLNITANAIQELIRKAVQNRGIYYHYLVNGLDIDLKRILMTTTHELTNIYFEDI